VDPRPAAEYPTTAAGKLSRNIVKATLVVIVFGGIAALTASNKGAMGLFIALGAIWALVLLTRSPHYLQAAILRKYPWTEWPATIESKLKAAYRSPTTRFVIVTLHDENGASYRHAGLYPAGITEGEQTVWFAGDPAKGGVVSFEQGTRTTRVVRTRAQATQGREASTA
jgi:hypothetical protein